jgi:hypothetical protein
LLLTPTHSCQSHRLVGGRVEQISSQKFNESVYGAFVAFWPAAQGTVKGNSIFSV